MGTLSYTATMSLDGCVADTEGDFQWSGPNDEVFQLHLDRMAEVSTEVLGRRTYQLMTYWEAEPPGGTGVMRSASSRGTGARSRRSSSPRRSAPTY